MSFFQKKSNVILVGLIALVAISTMWFFSTKNSLIIMEEEISGNWAQVENQLQRRYDLIPNLVNTVKGYAAQEKEIFTNIAEARSKLAGAGSQKETIAASGQMESAISRLLVVVENYPNLKSDANFRQLQDELAGSENRLSTERRRFNESVKVYNRSIRLFPKSFVANLFGFDKKDYFEIDQQARNVPKVEF